MMPKLTVLMAVYNGEAYLRECMDSVLNQTYKDFEFLIIDDGSTDSTRDIVRSYRDNRIRLIENRRNLSQVTSLNIGLDYARAEYIARIDADDIMLPHRLEKQLNFLIRRTDVALVGSWGEAIDETGKIIVRSKLPLGTGEIVATVLFGEFIFLHSSMMFRKKVVLDVGKYNEAFSFTEDYKLVTDLLRNYYKVMNMPGFLTKYRLHNDRISIRNSKSQIERYIIALREFIENFTQDFSELDRDLLFNFLINAGSMNKNYWEDGLTKKDIKKIIILSSLLLTNVLNYFKLSKRENYSIKRIFYNRVLNFAYQATGRGRKKSFPLYLFCLRNPTFLFTRPKLYLYPLRSVL